MAFTVTPAEPRATVDFAHIAVSGIEDVRGGNETGGEGVGAAFRYRVEARGPSGQVLKSHEFTPSPAGDHQWDGVAFDEDGEWTLALVDTADDSDAETDTLTVAAAS